MANFTVPKEILDKMNAGIQERFASSLVYDYTFAAAIILNLAYGVTFQKLIFKNTSAANDLLINFNGGVYNYTVTAGESVTISLDHVRIYVTGVIGDTFCFIGLY